MTNLLLLLLAAGLLTADPKSPSSATPDSGRDALRVATFNIRYGSAKDGENHWEKRRELFFDTLKRMDADVVGMQEVELTQLDEIKAAFPGYTFVGVGRDDGERRGEAVPVGWKAERFEKLEEGHFWLSPTPEKVGSKGWDAALPRISTWVRLKDRGTGKELLFVNTHFDHMGKTARTESAKLLRAKFAAMRRAGTPAVMVGDFNATEDEPPYPALAGPAAGDDAGKLVDSFRVAHPQRNDATEGTFHGFEGYRNGRRIDWILHTPDLETVSCEVVYHADGKRYPSDHYPVQAMLRPAAAENR